MGLGASFSSAKQEKPFLSTASHAGNGPLDSDGTADSQKEFEAVLDPLIAEKEDKLKQLLDPESTSKTRQPKDANATTTKGRFEAQYNFSALCPGIGDGLDQIKYENGVAVNVASSITQVARLNNQLDMSPTLKARRKP